MNQKRTAFVLSGGGAKGSLQVGMLRQLTERGIIPDAMYGCSVGALNTTGYTYAGMDELEKVWLGIKGRKSIVSFQFCSIFFRTKGLYSTKPLRKLVESITKNNFPSSIDATVVMNNIETGEVAYVTPYNAQDYGMTFADAVIASASMPIIMEPVKKVWLDGGIRETVPLAKAIEDGAEEIYILLCNPWTRNPDDIEHPKNWFDVLTRTIDVMTHEVFVNDIQDCIDNNNNPEKRTITLHLYAPPYTHTESMDFSPENIRKGIDMGYYLEEISLDFVRSIRHK